MSDQGNVLFLPSIWQYSVDVLPEIDLVIELMLLKPWHIRWNLVVLLDRDTSFSKLKSHYFGAMLYNSLD